MNLKILGGIVAVAVLVSTGVLVASTYLSPGIAGGAQTVKPEQAGPPANARIIEPEPAEYVASVEPQKFTIQPTGSKDLTLTLTSQTSGEFRLVISEEGYGPFPEAWDRVRMPGGFSFVGGQRTIQVDAGQTIAVPMTIATNNAEKGVHKLDVAVFYKTTSGWTSAGSTITVTVQG